MLSVNSDALTITGPVILTVNSRSIRAEVRASDSGVNLKIFAVSLRHIYYLVRFCLLGTKHNVTGQLGVSAYTFDDSNRAYASVRVGLRRIRPIFEQNEDGSITKTDAMAVDEDSGNPVVPLKLKFILYKYVFENWEDENKVSARRVQKEAFGRQLAAMFTTLQQNLIIPAAIPQVVCLVDRVIDPTLLEGLRPTAETLASGRLTVASVNNEVRRTDFSLPELQLNFLVASQLPFGLGVFHHVDE